MTESTVPMSDRLLRIAAWASAGFVLTIVAAALLYPGGSYLYPGARSYSFTANAFSDLGMFHTHGGHRNAIAMPLFVLAGTAIATVVPGRLLRSGAEPMLVTVTAILATITGIGFACVGLTPADKLLFWHGVSVYTAFASFGVLLLVITAWAWRRGERFLLWGSATLFVALVAYNYVLWFGPGLETAAGVITQVVAQKLVVLAAIDNRVRPINAIVRSFRRRVGCRTVRTWVVAGERRLACPDR